MLRDRKDERTVIGTSVNRWMLLIAGLVALLGTWLAISPAPNEAAPGVVIVKGKAPAPASVPKPGEGQAAAVRAPVAFSASPEVLAALRLPPGSVFRDTTTHDADDGVTCGEVSSSQGDRSFRRFVYIASARAGFMEDGGEAFRQISATSCVQR